MIGALGAFIKFGELVHLERLYNEGLVYCNSLDYFSLLESDHPAADVYENVINIHTHENCTLEFWPAEQPKPDRPTKILSPVSQVRNHLHNLGNVFCLHALDVTLLDKTIPYTIDKRNYRGDGYFLYIEDPSSFAQMMRDAIRKLNFGFKFGFVNYIDLSRYSGQKDSFTKDMRFAHEVEWRAWIKSNGNSVLNFRIGSLGRISKICKADIDNLELYLYSDNKIGLKNCEIL